MNLLSTSGETSANVACHVISAFQNNTKRCKIGCHAMMEATGQDLAAVVKTSSGSEWQFHASADLLRQVEATGTLAMRHSDELGHHLVATKALGANEVLLLEAPLLDAVSPPTMCEGWAEHVLRAFCASSCEIQSRVLNFHVGSGCVVPSASMLLDVSTQVSLYAGQPWRREHSDGVLENVCLVFRLNAYSYGHGGERSALFEAGSKFSHTCDHNVSYASQHDGGCFYTTRAVAIGEHLSCNYLGDYTRQMSTPARREALRDSKLFWCMCARCTRVADPDRHVPCPGCHPRDGDGRLADVIAFASTRSDSVRYAVPNMRAAAELRLGGHAQGAYATSAEGAATNGGEEGGKPWYCKHCKQHWSSAEALPGPSELSMSGRTWERTVEHHVLSMGERWDAGRGEASSGVGVDETCHLALLVAKTFGGKHWTTKLAGTIAMEVELAAGGGG